MTTPRLSPRWRKVLADMLGSKGRTLLVALSIAVGVFAVGTIAGAYLIIGHDLPLAYLAANPHAAAIAAAPFGDDLVTAMQRVPGVVRAEGRSTLSVRVEVKPQVLKPAQITGIPRKGDMRIDMLSPAQPGGSLPVPRDKEVLIERSSLAIVPVKPGDTLSLTLPDRQVRQVRVTGIVYDPNSAPASFTGTVALYANPATMEWLSGSQDYGELLLTVGPGVTTRDQVAIIAQAVADKIERSGHTVEQTTVEQPGEHPVGNIIQTFLVVLGALGVLTLALSGFLVVNTINALLRQQVRQIGMMKAVGARNGQIIAMYAVQVLGFGLLALLLAAPLAALASYGMSGVLARFLNFDLQGFRVLKAPLIIELAVAVLLPLLVSLWPVLSGTRITVREAINSYGLSGGQFGRGLIDRLLAAIRFLSRPLRLSLRNTVRRKGRLALTLSTLALAGAIFIAVLNLQASFGIVIHQVLGYFLSDVNVDLVRPYPIAEIENALATVPGVQRIEAWDLLGGEMLAPNGINGDQIVLLAPPAGSTLVRPVITAGRWLVPDDQNAIVVDNHMLKLRPDLKTGDEVTLKLAGQKHTWRIVGIYQMAGNVTQPLVYTNREYLSQLLDTVATAASYRVVMARPAPAAASAAADAAAEDRLAKAIQSQLESRNVRVAGVTTGATQIAVQNNSINLIIYFLLAMALLIALVGGLGLMGTMSMNVLERTREIGVMRAIGARDRSVMALVIAEGLTTGVLGWALGALFAVPITQFMDNVVGRAFVQLPVPVAYALPGFVLWLVLTLFLALLASVVPAWNADRISVREALAYE